MPKKMIRKNPKESPMFRLLALNPGLPRQVLKIAQFLGSIANVTMIDKSRMTRLKTSP